MSLLIHFIIILKSIYCCLGNYLGNSFVIANNNQKFSKTNFCTFTIFFAVLEKEKIIISEPTLFNKPLSYFIFFNEYIFNCYYTPILAMLVIVYLVIYVHKKESNLPINKSEDNLVPIKQNIASKSEHSLKKNLIIGLHYNPSNSIHKIIFIWGLPIMFISLLLFIIVSAWSINIVRNILLHKYLIVETHNEILAFFLQSFLCLLLVWFITLITTEFIKTKKFPYSLPQLLYWDTFYMRKLNPILDDLIKKLPSNKIKLLICAKLINIIIANFLLHNFILIFIIYGAIASIDPFKSTITYTKLIICAVCVFITIIGWFCVLNNNKITPTKIYYNSDTFLRSVILAPSLFIPVFVLFYLINWTTELLFMTFILTYIFFLYIALINYIIPYYKIRYNFIFNIFLVPVMLSHLTITSIMARSLNDFSSAFCWGFVLYWIIILLLIIFNLVKLYNNKHSIIVPTQELQIVEKINPDKMKRII